MQINQIIGQPSGLGFPSGPSSNFLNPTNSKPDNPSISSSTPAVNTHQSVLTSNSIAGSILSSTKVSQSSDVVKTLKEHPAYMNVPNDELEAIAAVILSTACCVSGIALLVLSGGSTAPLSITLASVVLTSAGTAGAINAVEGAIQGNFSWQDWGKEMLISAGTTLITFGAGYASAAKVASLCLHHPSIKLSTNFIEAIANTSSAVAGAITQGTSYSIIKEYSGEQIETFELFMQCVGGAYAGRAAGKVAFKAELRSLLRAKSVGQNIVGHNKGKGFQTEALVFSNGNKNVSVFQTHKEIIGRDADLIMSRIKVLTPAKGKVVIISGTHGNSIGQTVLEDMGLAHKEFWDADLVRFANLEPKRTPFVLDLAKYREINTLCKKIIEINPDTIVLNFCHGDQAMERGKLGTEIAQAFEGMKSKL